MTKISPTPEEWRSRSLKLKSSRSSDKRKETVTVLGSGDLSRGLIKCLTRGGYRVVVASRNPAKVRARIQEVGGEVAQFAVALQESSVIIMAIPFEAYADLKASQLSNKILVDVSNRPPQYDRNGPSMAQQLQDKIPGAYVVKALNTLSAYALQKGLDQGSKQVPICSDSEEAKFVIMNLVRKLGFIPVDYGTLWNARAVEDIPMEFFPEWKTAGVVTLLIFIGIWTIVLFRKQLCPNFRRPDGVAWIWDFFNGFPLKTLGNASAITSLNLLASCYFPGVLAGYIQLYKGTKYAEFPQWLDNWMKARKQLGLFALLLASIHAIIAFAIKISMGMKVHWKDQTYMAFGSFSLGLMAVLGVTSLPSVSSSLTWKEFSFVQGVLGWTSFVTGTVHAVISELDIILGNVFECIVIPHHIQIGIILPALTIALKLPLMIPCVSSYLLKIRRGYERNSLKYKENNSKLAFVTEAFPYNV